MAKTKEKNEKSEELFFSRELSWLEFNDRVLREGLSEDLPLIERLKFMAIVSSNLDEFFMIRVASLQQQRAAGVRKRDAAGMTPNQQLKAIAQRTHWMVSEQTAGIRDAFSKLTEHGLFIHVPSDWTLPQRRFLKSHFARELLPVLTPLALDASGPSPLVSGLQLCVALLIEESCDQEPGYKVAVVPVPSRFPRFLSIPGEDEGLHLVRLEDIVAEYATELFPGCNILSTAICRITRDADVAIQDDDASDLLNAVQEAVLARRRRIAVRLEISADSDTRLLRWFKSWLDLKPEDIYEIDGMLDAKALWEIAGRREFESLANPDWPPQEPRDLIGTDDIWQAVQDHDVMLFHPYESFDPVVRLVEQAADDPDVLAIKQTLYRTSGDSPIVKALERAATGGKEVTVLVELKARFDEARNVVWARRLEDAGCHVVYGVAGLKTHAKALLIVRRESDRIQRYVHLSTGNYNDKTALLYSDIGIITRDREIAADVAALFNLLTGYSEAVGWSKLAVEPVRLCQRFIELIDREIEVSTRDEPGLIIAKVNSLEHPDICKALYRASEKGVRVKLNVRGICCLRPGVKGLSENIEVRSIIDRYLEHARIFYFRNGGHEEVYMSSADWMRRNLDKRLETIFPITSAAIRRRLIEILKVYFADNVKSRKLLPDGTYKPIRKGRRRVRAQELFYQQAVEAVQSAEQSVIRYQPLKAPEE